MPSVVAESVSKTYSLTQGRWVTGLSPTSLSIESGSFVSIVGRSGCGKSTLLRLFAGLESPSSGRIVVEGEAVRRPPASARYVFQNYAELLLPWKTVGDNIRFGLRHSHTLPDDQADRGGWDALVEEKLAEVGLSGVADRLPAELSGGMQQRVAIARALASHPRVLLLDEPFSAVDALSRAHLQDLLIDVWAKNRLTVVFVTHDIDEALYLSDRVVVLAPSGRGIELDLQVDLPRPRDQIETKADPRFLELRSAVLSRVLKSH